MQLPQSIRWKEYTIRQATKADLDILMHHRRAMFLDMGRKDDEILAKAMRTSRDFFSNQFEYGRFHAWVVEQRPGTIIAGAGVITFDYPPSPRDPSPQRPMVVNVYTERAHRRKGIARKLMEIVIDWCRSMQFGSVMLHASDEGRPLYESQGFEQTNEMRLMLR